MPLQPAWNYINKGLLTILGVFVIATIASILFLSHTLLKLDLLISNSGKNVSTALLLQDIFINLDDADTSSRGYVIAGDDTYRRPYDAALKDLPGNLKALRASQRHDLSQAQYDGLKSLVDQKVANMQQTVEARSTGDEDAARAIMATGEGQRLMQQIRREVKDISDQSMIAIGSRQRQSRNDLQHALWVAGMVIVFVFGICIVLSWYFQYAIVRERALEGIKSEFLSLASHQLRTPATNVKQYVGLLLDGYLGDLTDKQRDALTVAYKNNESEIRIINNLLDVAKLDLKRIQIRKQRVDIVSIVRQVIKNNSKSIEAHGHTLTLKAPDRLMAMVDRKYFRSVIEKLVDNAVKYSHDKTHISVRIRMDEENKTFQVIVRDRGLGIRKREVPKLFMKFSRLTNEFSANTEGSGLGLYWVKQIMVLHGGSVRVASQEGRGSKFTVQAPIK